MADNIKEKQQKSCENKNNKEGISNILETK